MNRLDYYVRLGLWEVLEGLQNYIEELEISPHIFRSFILDINNKGFPSPVVHTPWHQVWLATSVLCKAKYGDPSAFSEVDSLRRTAEFQHVLSDLSNVEPLVAQELCHLYHSVLHADQVKENTKLLSTDAHKFVSKCLLHDALPTNILIQCLLCLWNPLFSKTDNELQELYQEVLEECVQIMDTRRFSKHTDEEECPTPYFSIVEEEEHVQSTTNTLLSLLSVLELSEEKEHNLVTWLSSHICETGVVPMKLVYFSLLSRSKLKLLKALSKIEDDKYRVDTDSCNTPERACEKLNSGGKLQIEHMFQMMIRTGKHWVEYIIEICSSLALLDFEEAMALCMSHTVTKNLLSLIVVHSWITSLDGNEPWMLLHPFLEICKETVSDPVLHYMAAVLEEQMLLLMWCQGSSLPTTEILRLAGENSTLETLRRALKLAEVEWDKVIQILQCSHRHEEKMKIDTDSTGTSAVYWDMVVFEGFCILMTAFQVIQSAMEIEKLIILRHPSIVNNGSVYLDMPAIQKLYTDEVVVKLQGMQHKISQILPLNFRVEILENIFSLLFLRYENFQEENSSDSGGEEDEYDELGEKGSIKSVTSETTLIPNISSDTRMIKSVPSCTLVDNIAEPQDSPSLSVLSLDDRVSLTSSDELKRQSVNTEMSAITYHPSEMPPCFSMSVHCKENGDICQHLPVSSGGAVTTDTFHKQSFASTVKEANVGLYDCHLSVQSIHVYDSNYSVNISDNMTINKQSPENISTKKLKNILARSGVNRNFVCSEFFVRDMLHFLKECIINSSVEFSNVQASPNTCSLGSDDIPSSVPVDCIQRRLNRLSQSVSDAMCRLHLLTSSCFMKHIGEIPESQHNLTFNNCYFTWQYLSDDSGSESEDDKDTMTANITEKPSRNALQKMLFKRKKSEAEHSSESGCHSTSTGGSTLAEHSHHKLRQLRRNTVLSIPNCIVTEMLSSAMSLAVQCLNRGDFNKAKTVIQVCDIEESSLAVDITFAEAFLNLRQKLKNCSDASGGMVQLFQSSIKASESHKLYTKKLTAPTLQTIKQVATAGVYATSVTSEVERFLSVTTLPKIQEAKEVITDFPQAVNLIQNADNGFALATIDLALTVGNTYEHSVGLLDLVCKHCTDQKWLGLQGNICSDVTNKQIPSYMHFIQNIIQILKLLNAECNEKSHSFLSSKLSVCDLLNSVHAPLSLKGMKEHLLFWDELLIALRDFQESLKSIQKIISQEEEKTSFNKSNEWSSMREEAEFRKLMKACHAAPVYKDIQRNSNTTDDLSSGGFYYLEQLNAYLKLLSTQLVENFTPKRGLSNTTAFFNILDDSVKALFGHLIFECNVPPVQLEPVAQMIGYDLVYSVVNNCCPSILDTTLKSEVDASLYKIGLKSTWGKVILNELQEPWKGPVHHPEIVVRTLLSDLLTILRRSTVGKKDCDGIVISCYEASILKHHPNVQNVLEQTQCLAVVDMSKLASGDEALVFFINLTNLLWVHSLLFLETYRMDESVLKGNQISASDLDKNRSLKKFGLLSNCGLERYISLKCVGYNVGQLGFVSLYSLQQILFGKDLSFSLEPSLKSFSSSEQHYTTKSILNSINVSSDPRMVFVLQNGQVQSPKVQVLFVEDLDTQLDVAMVDYLNNHVKLTKQGQVVIPPLLQWYQEMVYLNQEPESCATLPTLASPGSPNHFSSEMNSNEKNIFSSKEKLTLLLDFLHDNTSHTLQLQLSEYSKTIADMKTCDEYEFFFVNEMMYEFNIRLDYSQFEDGTIHVNSTGRVAHSDTLWKECAVKETVSKFLECYCWLLSVLVHKVRGKVADEIVNQELDDRTKYLDQLFTAEWVDSLKPLFEDNPIITSLNIQPDNIILWTSLTTFIKHHQWETCLETIRALPESIINSDSKLQALLDDVLFELASKLPGKDCCNPWKFCQHIGDICKQAECILRNLPLWPGSACEEALRTILEDQHRMLPNETRLQLKESLHKIQIYERVLSCCSYLGMKCWYDVSCTSEKDPATILNQLMDAKEFQLCLQWADLHGIHSQSQQLVDSNFLLLLLDPEPSDFTAARQLLLSLSSRQAILICDGILQQLKSPSCIMFIVNFLLESFPSELTASDINHYRLLSIGIQMLAIIPITDQVQFWDLIGHPQLIVEQLIMNTRLEMLERILVTLHPVLSQLPVNSPVSINSIDMMLHQYATKALDFRVSQTQAPCSLNPIEERLLVSLSVTSSYSEEFTMPDKVPAKTEWVPNDEVTQCMCCHSVTFSMFNRRHHCRRCGRVICGSCSIKRMKVIGYGDVSVRVCNDCYEQTVPAPVQLGESNLLDQSLGSTVSIALNPWKLTLDEAHNTTVREEFSFEHAPSVSLCLAILKLHSEQNAYPRFLLDSYDRMLNLLQPVGPGTVNPEIDYSLVIQMVRSLVVAAKVKYARYGLNTGVVHCDQLLSQVDLLSTLVKSGCSALIPAEPLIGHALRRLRDSLVEEEMWSLAMDVSTKGGFDRAGVWAAWGKACLQAGCWDEAREKFAHCLERVTSESESTRPLRNPPLLNEIVQILESGAYTVDRKILQQVDKIKASKDGTAGLSLSSPALSVLHTLASLKGITQGKYTQATPPTNTVIIGPKLDPLFYDECCYYLTTYGSHAGFISFYLSHDDLPAALHYILDQKVDADIFLEAVYLPCLFEGLTSDLHRELAAIDPSLETWKMYLCHICHHCERQGLLNVLYQLQLYMHDYIRAAMTCIRFYESGVRNYSDLGENIGYLHLAQTHLESEMATVTWGTTKRSMNAHNVESIHSKSHLAMKLEPREVDRHINTVLQQIEVTKFLCSCEQQQRPVLELIPELFQPWSASDDSEHTRVPTLFGNNYEKLQLAVLCILCGKNVEEGFGIAFRIIQDYNLKGLRVYSLAGKKLSNDAHLRDIEQLIGCIRSSGVPDTNSVCDEVLAVCVRVLSGKSDAGDIELLVKLMADVGIKISAYIESRQLKSAYLLAVKYDRLGDVRRILREAERLGQAAIRKICLKRLNQQCQP